ncbi:MAG: DUF4278 domain-containing protein [Cyanobacteria bacterium CRU_2_1]|nr:DUF4278 domain-containing protein [Cyanobacteria bacterium RU_5_0]NJR62181.1 DUF4278 domain-containing protein [Cyanobacteria bacterium CRU_2_1]
MKLCYRGINYEPSTLAVQTTEYQFAGKYRGIPMQIKLLADTDSPQSILRLTYRGATYFGIR